ncbi:hypothetical protein [Nannocystis radixulma]|uniref:Lipoprotein n=1 Tax=Nannocystis radixulma TaxID=2995305 RepID=A0ABT5BN67_9BACT|nr:hypothetical protein [Nannocystis radixulma]MDC0674437.1 hypothetical protein [Nannocystis radixulma]
MRNKLILSVTASLQFLGCSAALDPLDAEDSKVAFAAVHATQQAALEARSTSSDSTAFRTEVAATFDFDFACTGGGTAHLSGSSLVTDELVKADVSTDFASCKATGGGNITIDGSMHYMSSVTDSEVSSAMNGSLSFAGDIHGSCDFDVKTSVTNDEVMSTGSFCGHDAAVTVNF